MPDLKKMLTLEALSEALPSWLKRSTKPEYNADEIDSTLTTNQFVTASDKDNWNAKGTYSKPPGGIPKSDLSSIVQTSLEKADSALQSETDPTVPSWAKQTNKPSYTQDEVADGTTYKRVTQTEKDTWSGKQNALSTTQMQAVNSGINSTKVAQIETNKTNILYAINTGVKNIAFLQNGTYKSASGGSETTFVVENGVVTVTSTTADTRATIMNYVTLEAGTYIITNRQEDGRDVRLRYNGVDFNDTFTINSATTFEVRAYSYKILTNATITPLLCIKSVYDQDSSYQPPALPNYDLTLLEAEDRAALAEVVDSGAKNIAEIYNVTQNAITITTSGYTATFSGSASQDGSITWGKFHVNTTGDYVVYSNMSTSAGRFTVYNQTDSVILRSFYPVDNQTPIVLSLVAGKNYTIYSWFAAGTASACVIDLMICTKAAFGVSQKFVPYKYQSPTSIALQTETFNVAAANTYYKIFEQFVGGDSVNRLYKISAAAMYAGARPAALKVTAQSQTAGSTETTVREITADTDVNYLSTDYIYRTYGATIRIYASFKAVTNKGAAYLIIDRYKV